METKIDEQLAEQNVFADNSNSASVTGASASNESAASGAISTEKKKRRRGDRKDGRLIRSLAPMNRVALYIMPDRSGASVYFHDSFEITEVENYINKKRKQGLKGFGMMHVILASYVRVISQRPAVNRFLSGQKLFARDDDIQVLLTIKREMTLEAEETIIKMHFTPTDTADQVYEKINKLLQESRAESADTDFDKTASIISHIPGVLLKFSIWFLKLIDYFGLLPASLLEVSPFHGSFFITSMGSLGIPPVYHHLYDFGNIPAFMSFGAKRKQNEVRPDGTVQTHKYIDFTVVCDERICDGFYYASAFKLMRNYMRNPHQLDEPPTQVIRDVD